MTAQGWLQIAFYLAVLTALTPLLGAYMARVYQGERVSLERVFGPRRAADLPRAAHRPRPPAGLEGLRAGACSSSARSSGSSLYVILRTQGIHPFNPEGFDSGPWDVTFNTDVVVRHEHELAVLRRRDDASLLLADGGAGGAELRLRGGRHGGARSRSSAASPAAAPKELGNFWQDLDADAALHPAAAVGGRGARARLAGGGPDAERLGRLRRPCRAASRRSRSARSPRRSRSSSSARTAAASSTSTARCRSRTRRSSRTSSRCCSSC